MPMFKNDELKYIKICWNKGKNFIFTLIFVIYK